MEDDVDDEKENEEENSFSYVFVCISCVTFHNYVMYIAHFYLTM